MSYSDLEKNNEFYYSVITPIFEGPLDLLLQLIEKAELDITKLALAKVTDQYLQYLDLILDKSSKNVAEFIVIASKLIQIKSEILLPIPPTREVGEEDPGELLAKQLREYKRFKQISLYLSNRQAEDLRNYYRLAPSPIIEPDYKFNGITIQDLIDSVFAAYKRVENVTDLGNIVTPPKITIREKINQISKHLFTFNQITFFQLLPPNPERIDVVVTFLAMLELVKLHLINAFQESLFDDIQFEKSPLWKQDTIIDLEFGE
jgi:segregation and condensation protein A